MKTTSEYIDLIKAHSDEICSQFGVKTLRLFGFFPNIQRFHGGMSLEPDLTAMMP
jgi:predicted nucleotidyltransferase